MARVAEIEGGLGRLSQSYNLLPRANTMGAALPGHVVDPAPPVTTKVMPSSQHLRALERDHDGADLSARLHHFVSGSNFFQRESRGHCVLQRARLKQTRQA